MKFIANIERIDSSNSQSFGVLLSNLESTVKYEQGNLIVIDESNTFTIKTLSEAEFDSAKVGAKEVTIKYFKFSEYSEKSEKYENLTSTSGKTAYKESSQNVWYNAKMNLYFWGSTKEAIKAQKGKKEQPKANEASAENVEAIKKSKKEQKEQTIEVNEAI